MVELKKCGLNFFLKEGFVVLLMFYFMFASLEFIFVRNSLKAQEIIPFSSGMLNYFVIFSLYAG